MLAQNKQKEKEILLSENTYSFLKEEDLLLTEKKAPDEENKEAFLEERRLSFKGNTLYLKNKHKLEVCSSLKDPLSFIEKQYELSKPIYNKELDLSVLVKNKLSSILFFPGRLEKVDKKNENASTLEGNENYKINFKGNFTLPKLGNEGEINFIYSGQILALNGFFGFLLDEKIELEKNKPSLEKLENKELLEKAYSLLKTYWIEKKHYFFFKKESTKYFRINNEIIEF